MDSLLQPRLVTLIGLWLAGGSVAQIGWLYLSPSLLSYFSGVLGSFCLLIASAVWGLRDKLDDVMDDETLSSEEVAQTASRVAKERRRFTAKAFRVAVTALAAASPAISMQVAGSAMWQWMVIAAGVGVGDAAYTYLIANSWDEELRARKARRAVAAKAEEERQLLLARIEASVRPSAGGSGWSHRADDSWSAAPN